MIDNRQSIFLKQICVIGSLVLLTACGGGEDLASSSPSSPSAGTGAGGGNTGGSASLQACTNATYPGDTSDPQTYLFDKLAQFDGCAYRATNDSRYLADGNAQCKTLDGLLRATSSKFRPQFCNGATLRY